MNFKALILYYSKILSAKFEVEIDLLFLAKTLLEVLLVELNKLFWE